MFERPSYVNGISSKFFKAFGVITASVLFPLAILLSSSNVHAEIFVSTTGSDATGDGSIENPFLTPVKAVSFADPDGETITFREGSYPVTDEIRIYKPNMVFRSHPNEWAKLVAPINDNGVQQILWFKEPSIGGKVQRLELVGGYLYTIKFENAWSQIDSIHVNRNYLVEDSYLHDSGRDLIKIAPGIDNVVIRRNHFARSGQRDSGNADGIDNVNGNNLVVQDNFFEDIATSVLYAKGGAKNALIERNVAINVRSGILLGFSTDIEFFDRDNLDENGRPVYENINSIVRNNIIINAKQMGIGLFAAYQPQVYNNTLVNTATEQYASLTIEPDSDPYHALGSSTDVTIRNNIIVQAADAKNNAVRVRCHSGVKPCRPGLAGYLKMSNNIYYKNGAQPTFEYQTPEGKIRGDLASWQASTKTDTNSRVLDPKLDANYHLTAESLAINAGYNIDTILSDFDGNARSDQFDIGADEFGGTLLQTPPRSTTIGTGTQASGADLQAPLLVSI